MLTLSNSPVSTRHLHERQPLGSANRAAYGGSRISEACEVKEPGSPIHVGAHVVRSAAADRANPVPSASSTVRQRVSVRKSACIANHSGRSPAKALGRRRTSAGRREAGPTWQTPIPNRARMAATCASVVLVRRAKPCLARSGKARKILRDAGASSMPMRSWPPSSAVICRPDSRDARRARGPPRPHGARRRSARIDARRWIAITSAVVMRTVPSMTAGLADGMRRKAAGVATIVSA